MDMLISVFKCAQRGIDSESPMRPTPGASDRCVCGHWTELRGSLYSIRRLQGFAAVEQKHTLMPNCCQRKDQWRCYICRMLLFLLQSVTVVQMCTDAGAGGGVDPVVSLGSACVAANKPPCDFFCFILDGRQLHMHTVHLLIRWMGISSLCDFSVLTLWRQVGSDM